jgi:hypothetical protein
VADKQKGGGVAQVVAGARIHARCSACSSSIKASVHTHRRGRGVAFDGGAARCRGCWWQSKSGCPSDDFDRPSCPIAGPESERSLQRPSPSALFAGQLAPQPSGRRYPPA